MATRILNQRFGGVLTLSFSRNYGNRRNLYTSCISISNTRERSTQRSTALHSPFGIITKHSIRTKQPSLSVPPSERSYSSASVSNGMFYPRRAVMYVPASDERKTKKAASLNVDTIVYDLEDGVAANQKVNLFVCRDDLVISEVNFNSISVLSFMFSSTDHIC